MSTPFTRIALSCSLFPIALCIAVLSAQHTSAAGIPSSDFSLEVSPSPLVMTVRPGEASTIELKIRNASSKAEDLKIEARDFKTDQQNGEITLGDTTPPDLAEWVSFSSPRFTAGPGEWTTQNITVSLPEAAGFSYPFAVVVSRTSTTATPQGSNQLKGSVAVFTLVNVDKPGATRKLEIDNVKSSQGIYEFLPATINVKLKNTGNSIVQPYGNIFVQRGDDNDNPLETLPLNAAKSYILPNTTRQITATWAKGFPHYETSQPDAVGKTTQKLTWNWNEAGSFRFGRYTAKVVAVYNDGTRDVPVTGEVSFWVIPWRILLGALVLVLILGAGLWTIIRHVTQRLPTHRNKR